MQQYPTAALRCNNTGKNRLIKMISLQKQAIANMKEMKSFFVVIFSAFFLSACSSAEEKREEQEEAFKDSIQVLTNRSAEVLSQQDELSKKYGMDTLIDMPVYQATRKELVDIEFKKQAFRKQLDSLEMENDK
jgi:PBP1b-binding outer membrane lipoprotein LpoB